MDRVRHLISITVAAVAVLALPLAGCKSDEFVGCWEHWSSALAVGGEMSIALIITDDDGDGEMYEIEGGWAHTDDPDPVLDPFTWPRIGSLTGIAIRDGDRFTISAELEDCDGRTVGTMQADDLWIDQWIDPGSFVLQRVLTGDFLVQADDFTHADELGAYESFCPGPAWSPCP